MPGSFEQRLAARLGRAPAELLQFRETCTLGDMERLEQLLQQGVVSWRHHLGHQFFFKYFILGCKHAG